MTREEKQQAHEILMTHVPDMMPTLEEIDQRLGDYFQGLTDEPDMHNGYEMLCAVKCLT